MRFHAGRATVSVSGSVDQCQHSAAAARWPVAVDERSSASGDWVTYAGPGWLSERVAAAHEYRTSAAAGAAAVWLMGLPTAPRLLAELRALPLPQSAIALHHVDDRASTQHARLLCSALV